MNSWWSVTRYQMSVNSLVNAAKNFDIWWPIIQSFLMNIRLSVRPFVDRFGLPIWTIPLKRLWQKFRWWMSSRGSIGVFGSIDIPKLSIWQFLMNVCRTVGNKKFLFGMWRRQLNQLRVIVKLGNCIKQTCLAHDWTIYSFWNNNFESNVWVSIKTTNDVHVLRKSGQLQLKQPCSISLKASSEILTYLAWYICCLTILLNLNL